MLKKFILPVAAATVLASSSAMAYSKMFYVLRFDQGIPQIKQNHNSIDLLIAQGFRLQRDGSMKDQLTPELVKAAQDHQLKLMPFLTNFNFDMKATSAFLRDEAALKKSIQSITELCTQQKLSGVQLDFEHLNKQDKKEFASYYHRLALALHEHKCKISVAVIPPLYDTQPTAFYTARDKYWSGGYDLAQLGKDSDFLVLMSYNQHSEGRYPGPVASYPWTKQTITYALRYVPKEKLVLGVPGYSVFWGIGGRNEISYDTAMNIVKTNHVTLRWDEADKNHYVVYSKYFQNQYLFVEDARSLHYKLQLRKEFGLAGIAMFRLGVEDPKIWAELAAVKPEQPTKAKEAQPKQEVKTSKTKKKSKGKSRRHKSSS